MLATHRSIGSFALVMIALVCSSVFGQNLDILSGQKLDPARLGAQTGGPESIVAVKARIIPASAARPAMLAVTATIAPPWYTYSTTQKPIAATPTVIKVDSTPDYRLAGEFRPNLPPTIEHQDGMVFEEFAPEVTWQAPLEVRAGVALKDLKVLGSARIQVCKKGACLSPTDFPFTALAVAEESRAIPAASAPSGVYVHPHVHATIRGHLEPSTVVQGATVNLVITAEPTAGYHVYELADRDTGALGYKPTLIVLTNTSGFQTQPTKASEPAVEAPPAIPGGEPQHYHTGRVTWTTPIVIPKDVKPGQYTVAGIVGYQTCKDDVGCDLPTATRFEGTVTVGAASVKFGEPLAFGDAKYIEAAKAAGARPLQAQVAVPDAEPASLSTLPMIIVASLIGGFILNFMPCVLPVIGLKILSFAEQAGHSRAQILALNVWYCLGSMAVFLVLATLATAVNLGLGEQNLGWGEQFKFTSFNVIMVAIVFVMSLSFLGVWEIPIPGFVGTGPATEIAAREGATGAFFKGVLTTVLATPCSGPLLGPVFGFTLHQAPPVTFLIFGCIGLGMSSPYLLIGAFPSLIRFLPKPGAWMDTFKQMMGFMMLGTIVFIFNFMDPAYIVPTFAMMVGLWAGCWWIGRTPLFENFGRKMAAWTQGAVFAALATWFAFTWLVPHESVIPWKDFSQSQLAKLTSEGNTVMIDFTANWCATCKVNSYVAIETNDVRQLIEQNRVVPMLADYTDGSPEIKDMLEVLKSASIPLLAIYPADKPSQPIVLRDVVTKQMVLDALKQAGPSKTGGTKPLAAMP